MTRKMGWSEEQEQAVLSGMLSGKSQKALVKEVGLTAHILYNCVKSLRAKSLLPYNDKEKRSNLISEIREMANKGYGRDQIIETLGVTGYDLRKSIGRERFSQVLDGVKRKCLKCKKIFTTERSSGSWHCSQVCRKNNLSQEGSDGIVFDYIHTGSWKQMKS